MLPMPPRATDGLQVGYYLFNGGLFRLFGEAPAAPAVINVFFGAWAAVLVYLLVLRVVRGNQISHINHVLLKEKRKTHP